MELTKFQQVLSKINDFVKFELFDLSETEDEANAKIEAAGKRETSMLEAAKKAIESVASLSTKVDEAQAKIKDFVDSKPNTSEADAELKKQLTEATAKLAANDSKLGEMAATIEKLSLNAGDKGEGNTGADAALPQTKIKAEDIPVIASKYGPKK